MLENLTDTDRINRNDAANIAVHSSFGFLGLLLNILTLIIILKGRRFGKGIKLQLVNLAIADLILSLTVPGSSVVGEYITLPYPNSTVLCRSQVYLTLVSGYGSLLSSTAISLEKFVAVCFPLKMVMYQRRHIVTIIILIWVFAVSSQLHVLVYSDVYPRNANNGALMCKVFGDRQFEWYHFISSIYTPIIFLLPAATICVMYALVGTKLLLRKRIGSKHLSNRKTGNYKVCQHIHRLNNYKVIIDSISIDSIKHSLWKISISRGHRAYPMHISAFA